jgi:hypothetical protein
MSGKAATNRAREFSVQIMCIRRGRIRPTCRRKVARWNLSGLVAVPNAATQAAMPPCRSATLPHAPPTRCTHGEMPQSCAAPLPGATTASKRPLKLPCCKPELQKVQLEPQFPHVALVAEFRCDKPIARIDNPPVRNAKAIFVPSTPCFTVADSVRTKPRFWQSEQTISASLAALLAYCS